jgi:hypothetical protein
VDLRERHISTFGTPPSDKLSDSFILEKMQGRSLFHEAGCWR